MEDAEVLIPVFLYPSYSSFSNSFLSLAAADHILFNYGHMFKAEISIPIESIFASFLIPPPPLSTAAILFVCLMI